MTETPTLELLHERIRNVEQRALERINENQQLSDERHTSLQKQIAQERESLSDRFEQANRYKETYSEALNRISNESVKRAEFESKLDNVNEKVEIIAKPNYAFWGIASSGIVALAGALWYIISMKIETTNTPIALVMEQVRSSDVARDRTLVELRNDFNRLQSSIDVESSEKSRLISNLTATTEASRQDRSQLNERLRKVEERTIASAEADANSRQDRIQLNDRVKSIETDFANASADRKAVEASLKSALVEIETQFCAADSLRNLMHANDLRIMKMLWDKAKFGAEYPVANAYYPQVCNHNIQTK